MQATIQEITSLIAKLPKFNQECANLCALREGQLTKPAGALGRLEELSHWYYGWRGQYPAQINHPRIAVFAGNHGIAKQNVSAFPPEVTAQMVANFQHGGAAINQLCKFIDADLKVYELNLDKPTEDFSQKPAMSEAELCQAMVYGMMAVEDGVDIIGFGEMGIANSCSAAAMAHAMFGGEASDWTGRGTGIDDKALAHKANIVAKSVALHQDNIKGHGLKAMQYLGGFELAAIAGAVIAARMAKIPVVLDGYACTVAASCLLSLDATILDHCQIGHVSAEIGHKNLLKKLAKSPLFAYEMRLGEGTGAALGINMVKAALACHIGMATFAEAMVSNKG